MKINWVEEPCTSLTVADVEVRHVFKVVENEAIGLKLSKDTYMFLTYSNVGIQTPTFPGPYIWSVTDDTKDFSFAVLDLGLLQSIDSITLTRRTR